MRAELIGRAAQEAWAMLPTALMALLSGDVAHEAQPLEALAKRGPKTGSVARIPVMGGISKRASIWSMFFGGATVEGITAQIRQATADPEVGTILLHIDSPGGTVGGLVELAAEIRAARESKHVVALTDGLMASAAYWLGSQADEIVATPDALVGSIGVFTVHNDWTGWNEQVGIKPTYIFAGKYKVEGNPDAPLSEEARQHMQGLVDDAYRLFVADVAKGRGRSAAEVRGGFGEGRLLTPKEAQAAGMIDRIAGVDETVARLTGRKAEADEETARHVDDGQTDVVNSQARIALMRRRLNIQQKL